MTPTPTPPPNKPRLTDEKFKEIPASEIEKLHLRLGIQGVRYTLFDDQPGVQVLIQATFVLPEGKYLEYARLPFQGLYPGKTPNDPPKDIIQVEAIMPEGKQMAYLGAYDINFKSTWAPEVGVGAAGMANVDVKFFETTKEINKRDIPQSISLIGYKATSNERSLWEFRNELSNGKELRDLYPTHFRLIAAFSTHNDSESEDFPFYLRFSSDCQVTFGDHVTKMLRHAIGRPRQYQFYIQGPYKEDVVEKHIQDENYGLFAAMKSIGMKEWLHPLRQQASGPPGSGGLSTSDDDNELYKVFN